MSLCVNCDGLCMQSTVDKMSEFIMTFVRRVATGYEIGATLRHLSSTAPFSTVQCTQFHLTQILSLSLLRTA